MPKRPSDLELEPDQLFKDLAFDLTSQFASSSTLKNIVEFIETEIDQEKWGITPNVRQWAILKAFYGVQLTVEEESILESWTEQDRSTWTRDHDQYQSLVLECGRRAGKCRSLSSMHIDHTHGLVYGYELFSNHMPNTDSFLLLEDRIEKAVDLRPSSYLPFSVKVAQPGKAHSVEADGLFYKGLSTTRKIETAAGYKLEATPEHRIKVMTQDGTIQWKYFADLAAGDYACINRGNLCFPENDLDITAYRPDDKEFAANARLIELPSVLDESLGYLIGILTANGTWNLTNRTESHLCAEDLELYLGSYKAVFSEANIKHKQTSEDGYQVCLSSVQVRKFLDNLGWKIGSSVRGKVTPWAIRRSSMPVVCSYLAGLFDGDGTISQDGKTVSLSTASLRLAEETQVILLNLGIVSVITTKEVDGRDYYEVQVRGKKSLLNFYGHIKLKTSRKLKRLEAYIQNSLGKKDGGDTERIPYQEQWLKKLRASAPSNRGKQPGSHAHKCNDPDARKALPKLENIRAGFRAIVGNSIKAGCSEHFSYYRLDDLILYATKHELDFTATEHFREIQSLNYFFDPIVSVEESQAECFDLSVPETNQYIANGFTNHNTMISSVIIVYEFYRLCHLPEPQKHYGIASSTPISILVLATSAAQAKRTIFKQVIGMMRVCKYFERLIEQQLITIGQEEIKFEKKLLYIYSGNSQSSSQVGQSVLLLAMDEVTRFKDIDGDSNALELWSNIGISGINFGSDAKRLAISSAWYEGDAIQKLYQSSAVDNSWLGFRLRTWDVNPIYNRENALIASEYNLDPRRAALECEGVRGAAEDAFFDQDEVVRAFRGSNKLYTFQTSDSDGLIRVHIDKIEPCRDYLSVVHLDPSVITDSYGFAIGHAETISGDYQDPTLVVIDGLIAWRPDPTSAVSITNVQEVIFSIHASRPISKISADHHNSWETLERFRMYGIKSESLYFTQKLQLEMYDNLRLLLHENRITFPSNSAFKNLLLDELTRLQLIKGKKIDHPLGSSKDLADAVAGVAWQLTGKNARFAVSPVVYSTQSSSATQTVSDRNVYLNEFRPKSYGAVAKDIEDQWRSIREYG